WLLPFLKNIIAVFALIGGHQIFEFLSLATHSQIIYKIGLLLSISSMYFLIRSLEVILNRNLRSKIVLLIIGAVAIHAFLIEMSFESHSFYLRHNSAFVWASAWMLLFIYFHICALKGRNFLKDDISKKAIITYLLATLDISFILSVIYTLIGYSQFSVNVCIDSPSIWCTFYVVQIFALPLFLSAVPKILDAPKEKTNQTPKQTILYFIFSIAILAGLISTLPFFKCLSLKFVFS
ncbi:MAG: hypothetical protein AAB666_02560, partial [Patescibacteria group bacterium]